MANELKHGSVGTELTQAEWEGIGTHVFSSQATGDLAYASSATQLSRLAISGTATHILSISGGVPVWAAPAAAAAGSLTGSTLASGVTASSLTSVGTIATGVWEGTTVAVDQGGTGATSLSNLIALSTMTTGNYVATVTGGTGITSTGATSGEGIAHSLSVDASQTQITAVGTIATGVWQGTDVGVAYGGTGVSTLTDGGILLGSGSGAITAMAVLADSEMIVGNGSTDPVAESGATLRTSIGVGTGDSPQFTGLTLTAALSTTSDIDMQDGDKLLIGTHDDLQIFHDGSHSYIQDTATGNLVLNGSGIYLINAANDENMLAAVQDAGVTLYHNGTAKMVTTADGLDLGDNDLLNVGASGSDWDTTSLRNAGDYFGANAKGMVIGHTAKIADMGGSGMTPEFQVLGTGQGDAAIGIGSYGDASVRPRLVFFKTEQGTIGGGKSIVGDDDSLGMILFAGDDGVDYQTSAVRLEAFVDGTPGSNDMPGRFTISTTADGSNSVTERMRIDNAGNVLIGTGSAAVSAKLLIETQGTGFQSQLSFTNPQAHAAGVGHAINFYGGSGDQNMAAMQVAWEGSSAGDGAYLQFATRRVSDGSLIPRLKIIADDGDIDLINHDLKNVGASGNDWTKTQLSVNSANDGGYNTLYVNNSSTSADSRARLVVQAPATSGASDPYIYFAVTSGEDVTYGLDQSDSDNLVWSDSDALGTNNRMKLVPSTGVLSVDGDGGGSDDPVSLFDELDDAMEIRRFQLAIPQAPISPAERQANRNRMVEIGVGEWAVQEDGSHRYMDRVQPLSRFLAGGIYQNRERMDAQNEAMDERLKRIEQALGV